MSQIDAAQYIPMFAAGAGANLAAYGSSDYENTDRISRYLEYWRFYKGRHWSYDRAAETGEPTVTINYSAALADRQNSFLMKNGFDITLPDLPQTVQDDSIDRMFIKNVLDETWQANHKVVFNFELAQCGGVTGDAFLYFSWQDRDPLSDPYVQVDILPSHYCFPTLGGPYGRDRKYVEAFTIVFPVYRARRDRFGRSQRGNAQELVMRSEVCTATTRTVYEGKDVVQGPDPNPFGEIPIVHIPNFPVSGDYYGLSDLVNIVSLQQELNEKCTDVSDIINYHSAPLNVFTGAQPNQLQGGTNRMWFLPAGATHTLAELRGDLAANLEYIKFIRQCIFEMANTPESALGHSEAKQQQQAAASQSMEYLPLVDRRAVKVQLYGDGLMLANRMILKIKEIMDPAFRTQMDATGLTGAARYRTGIVFSEAFGRNEDLELSRTQQKLTMGLTTRERALRDLGHGEADAKKIVAEALAEKRADAEMQLSMATAQKEASGNPNPQRPNPNVQSEHRSTTVEKKATS